MRAASRKDPVPKATGAKRAPPFAEHYGRNYEMVIIYEVVIISHNCAALPLVVGVSNALPPLAEGLGGAVASVLSALHGRPPMAYKPRRPNVS